MGLVFKMCLLPPRESILFFLNTITAHLQMSKEAPPRTSSGVCSHSCDVCVQECHVFLANNSFGIKLFSVLNTRDVNLGACSQSHHPYRTDRAQSVLYSTACSHSVFATERRAAAPSQLDISPVDYETWQ